MKFIQKRMGTPCVFVVLFCAAVARAQPYPQAHAHNDYEHDHPLFDALRHGFTSVEADIYCVDGALLVSHMRPVFRSRTLEQLYLIPLDSIVRAHRGKVYAGYDGPFYLMIDIKSEAESTYSALKTVLSRYPALEYSPSSAGPVVIFLSGNRPKDTLLKDPLPMVALDGRPEDLGKDYRTSIMPVISDTYKKWSDWNGEDTLDDDHLKKIKDLALRVHAEGKKLRLWAIPDNPVAWKALLESGVDLINTDDLEGLHKFFQNAKKQ